jgi:hypothetical protein
MGCVAMDTVTYPDKRVSKFVSEDFVPLKVKVKENPKLVEEYRAHWTPTFVIADAGGRPHYRLARYRPADDFMGRLGIGLGMFWLDAGEFDEARRRWDGVAARHAGTEMAAEALYWSAVAHYKASSDANQLKEGWKKLSQEYPASEWTRSAKIPRSS